MRGRMIETRQTRIDGSKQTTEIRQQFRERAGGRPPLDGPAANRAATPGGRRQPPQVLKHEEPAVLRAAPEHHIASRQTPARNRRA